MGSVHRVVAQSSKIPEDERDSVFTRRYYVVVELYLL